MGVDMGDINVPVDGVITDFDDYSVAINYLVLEKGNKE